MIVAARIAWCDYTIDPISACPKAVHGATLAHDRDGLQEWNASTLELLEVAKIRSNRS